MQSQGYDIAIEDVNPLMGYEKPLAIRMMLETREEDKAKITDALVNRDPARVAGLCFLCRCLSFYKFAFHYLPFAEGISSGGAKYRAGTTPLLKSFAP